MTNSRRIFDETGIPRLTCLKKPFTKNRFNVSRRLYSQITTVSVSVHAIRWKRRVSPIASFANEAFRPDLKVFCPDLYSFRPDLDLYQSLIQLELFLFYRKCYYNHRKWSYCVNGPEMVILREWGVEMSSSRHYSTGYSEDDSTHFQCIGHEWRFQCIGHEWESVLVSRLSSWGSIPGLSHLLCSVMDT